MGGQITKLGKSASNVINNMEISGSMFMQLESRIEDLKTVIDNNKKYSNQ